MTFEEMQLLLQSIVVSQRETDAILRETAATVQETAAALQETKKVVDSNSRAIQAMLDQSATDRLNHEARMEKLERLSEGLVNMLSSIDEDRPTILRKLNTIEQKTNSILDRLPPNN
jgi:methionine synthase I (cobalamin-dependent)